MSSNIPITEIIEAGNKIKDLVKHTPLEKMLNSSERFQSNIFFKREDLQRVRSYKIRGAFHKIKYLAENKSIKTVVCASAGNHAQGVAQACHFLGISGVIFMPTTTPKQKINQVEYFGKDNVEIKLYGDTFDASYAIALEYSQSQQIDFVHPFDDEKIIAGQGTVGLEILQDMNEPIDYIFVPVGGGGLVSGIISVFNELSPKTKIIGVEPEGAPSLKTSLKYKKNTELHSIDKFVDGAAVKKIGDLPFSICQNGIDEVITIPEGKICSILLKLYNEKAIVAEPAGALSIAALDYFSKEIKGKNVVCVLSGGNNDITRMEEIKERALLFEGLKHYFIVPFPQRAGALKEFVVNVLGANDDITFFEYTKKNNRDRSAAVVGIELKFKEDFAPLVKRMKELGFMGEYLNENPQLFQFLI
ncbi:threonine ammonia-lyase IlvA [Namhaeicola litoreus]|uniref:L-threonine dehydratase n=1 Tax=Namhaeicola litoreus TaxID=1052145 RepID=A0ABW3XXY6_9FLAO